MSSLKTCKTCGVPLRFGKDHSWNSDGTITQRRDPDHRMILFDCKSLDTLFANIEQLIGMPIEKIIIESKARATRDYVARQIIGVKGTAARLVGIGRVVGRVIEQGRLLGYGDITNRNFDWKRGSMLCEVGHPYSLPLFCGDLLGSIEAIRKLSGRCTYEETGPGRYMIETHAAEHTPELQDRLMPRLPARKPGDVKREKCPGCKAPQEVSRFKWDLEKGTIVDSETGMRLAMFGPVGLQVIFDELESELGESIPETIVEAQRRQVDKRLDRGWKLNDPANMSRWLSLQGMGNLISMSPEGEKLVIAIQNVTVPLVLVGTALGIFEAYSGSAGSAEWDIAGDGDLTIKLSPA